MKSSICCQPIDHPGWMACRLCPSCRSWKGCRFCMMSGIQLLHHEERPVHLLLSELKKERS
jgi:hypothetical protein